MEGSSAIHYLLLLLVTTATIIWLFSRNRTRERPSIRSVAILVLGDIGRSPRMMYHAESFAENQFETYVIGNKGSQPIPSLLSLPRVHFLYLPTPPNLIPGTPFIISAPRKVIQQVFSILYALLYRIPHPPEFIIVQNPPSIPTLALVWLVSKIRGSKVIIDWHNLGHSILAMKLGPNHLFVKVAKWFESYFGRTAYAHLFVTNAMHDYLVREWGLQGYKIVLHDRPPAHFHKASASEMHELFLRLNALQKTPILAQFLPNSNPPYSTPFTQMTNDHITEGDFDGGSPPMPELRPDRPALLVSSTSWTPDEDFGVLSLALDLYDEKAKNSNRGEGGEKKLPKVLMIVTGKGPEKEEYMKQVNKLQEKWEWVRYISVWLEPKDYPLLLGSADLGISLHSSSSALDLPMKIVDMFGCGLPVCALDFACLDELVKDGVNGLVFRTPEQLAIQLETLLASFPSSPRLETLRNSLVDDDQNGEWGSWAQNWNKEMRPILLRDVKSPENE